MKVTSWNNELLWLIIASNSTLLLVRAVWPPQAPATDTVQVWTFNWIFWPNIFPSSYWHSRHNNTKTQIVRAVKVVPGPMSAVNSHGGVNTNINIKCSYWAGLNSPWHRVTLSGPVWCHVILLLDVGLTRLDINLISNSHPTHNLDTSFIFICVDFV